MATSASYECGEVSLHVRTWSCPAPTHPPVLLLPGTGLTATDWEPIAADLAHTRLVHAVDLRGHGASSWPGTYSIDLMAGDVLRLLTHLGPRLDVVGHSLGGLVACLVAVSSPRVRRLVLEDVGLLRPRSQTPLDRPVGTLPFDWAMVEQVRPEVDTPSQRWRDVLGSLSIPVLAVSGGSTSFVPVEWVEDLVAVVPGATMVTVEAGHEIHAGRPGEFLDAVLPFLSRQEPTTSARMDPTT